MDKLCALLFVTVTVTISLKNESSTEQVDDNIQHISVRDFIIVVALIVCVSFVTSFCCVMKIRHQIIQRSYNTESPLVFNTTRRSLNDNAIELNEDHHLYQEINELEPVNPSGEGIFIHVSNPELENVDRQIDDDDYLHPYHSLIHRSHIDDHKYEDLVIKTSYNYIFDAMSVNINRCTHKQLRDTFRLNRFGGNKKIMFYSEPFNLHKYMFQYSLTQSDIKVNRQVNKSLDTILNAIGVQHIGVKQIDDNISLD